MEIIIIVLLCISIMLNIYIIYNLQKESYNYSKENPNALISGKPIGGSVYASYPEQTPGLGWIL